jgi:hypothetical protein
MTVAPVFTARSPAWRQRKPSGHSGREGRPLIIGACPRSGTTLLRSLLDNHPDLAIPPETDFVLPAWRRRAAYGNLRDGANRRRLAEWIFCTDGTGGRRIRVKGLADKHVRRDDAIARVVASSDTLGSLLAECFALYADSHGKARWGDKRPAYAGHIDAVFRLWPHAQFVNVVRDPRATVASIARLGWHRRRVAVPAATAMWEMSLQRVDRRARRLRPDQLLDVRYEDLVRDPRGTLQAIVAFAGLRGGDAIDEMLAGERRAVYRPGWHERVAQPIDDATVEAWRGQLRPGQVALIEHATAAQMARFGYLPCAEVDPRPGQLARLERQRERRRRRWRREDVDDLKRRFALAPYPVSAVRGP